MGEQAIDLLNKAKEEIIREINAGDRSREKSLALTKIEEAIKWYASHEVKQLPDDERGEYLKKHFC